MNGDVYMHIHIVETSRQDEESEIEKRKVIGGNASFHREQEFILTAIKTMHQ